MKHYYTFIFALLITCTAFSQTYQFGIVHNGGYSFSVVANPDFDVTNSDVSDIGFALMLPAGNADITNISDKANATRCRNLSGDLMMLFDHAYLHIKVLT